MAVVSEEAGGRRRRMSLRAAPRLQVLQRVQRRVVQTELLVLNLPKKEQKVVLLIQKFGEKIANSRNEFREQIVN